MSRQPSPQDISITDDWSLAKFADVADYKLGRTPPRRSTEYWSQAGGIPWVTISDMPPFGTVKVTSETVSPLAAQEVFQSLPVPKDTLLMSFKLTIGRTAILGIDAYHNEAIISIRPKPDIDRDFLRFYLPTLDFTYYQDRAIKGQTLNRGKIDSLPVPMPPFQEQRAIATVLSKLLAGVEVQEKIVATLKELKAATMAKLFRDGIRGEPLKQTEIGEIPKSWEVVPLGELAERITKGSSPRWQGFNYCDDGVLFIRSQNVGFGELLLSNTVYLPEEFNRKERRSVLSVGDVLINIVGASIGRAAVADERLYHANINQAVALVRLRPNAANPSFLEHFLISTAGLKQMHRQKKEIARANLSLEDINSFLVPVPALDEQNEIGRSLGQLGRMVAVAEHKRDTLKALFSSMLHRLMTGQVRVTRKMIALQALEDRRKRRPKWSGKVDEKVLKEIVRQIVEVAAPEKIILFGSAVRGEMGPDSDLDFLVIKSCTSRRETAWAIRRALIGIKPRLPIDIIVATPQDIERYKNTIGLIYRPAFREGKVLYAP